MIRMRGLTHLVEMYRDYTQFFGVECDGKVDAYRYLVVWSGFRSSRVPVVPAHKTKL